MQIGRRANIVQFDARGVVLSPFSFLDAEAAFAGISSPPREPASSPVLAFGVLSLAAVRLDKEMEGPWPTRTK